MVNFHEIDTTVLDMIAPVDTLQVKQEQASIEGVTYDSPFDKYYQSAKVWQSILDDILRDVHELSIADTLSIDAIKL